MLYHNYRAHRGIEVWAHSRELSSQVTAQVVAEYEPSSCWWQCLAIREQMSQLCLPATVPCMVYKFC